ncbi:tetratricopeptide repeat protein [Ideonella sp.]|uniref:tetratricopeptide repeat protein n=1 Tax=Ideonella sp. TaxID=1929293 RepID=UPI003BB65D4D
MIGLIAVWSAHAQAQVIEDVELRRDGANVVMTVRMAQPIQFRRSVNSATDELVQVYYDIVPGRERPQFIEGERKVLGGGALPRISVSEDGGGAALTDRKLVIRLDRPLRMRARAGRDSRSLEVQIDGLGEAYGNAQTGQVPARTGTASTPAAAPIVKPAPALSGSPSDDQINARATELLATARAALARGNAALAIEHLNEALNLPPHARSAEAQALIGNARLATGDVDGARRELSLYLSLYPRDPDADMVRQTLASLAPGATDPKPRGDKGDPATDRKAATTTISGAWSQYYFGGNSKTLTQLKDTPLEGQIPQIISESQLSGADQKQLVSALDFNWRSRDADRDIRFGFRDSFTWDAMPGRPNQHKPTALYLDWKELEPGLSARVGRQSGLGGGVLGRFDGVQAGWRFRPKWKLNLVGGQPTDELLDTRRWFAGASVDAESLAPNLGASSYLIQQNIDGQIDRRAMGVDLRWFEPTASVFSQLEYDLVLKGLNTASVQGTYTLADNTTFNLLLDHRATPMLMLGNALFFADPTQTVLPRTLDQLLQQRSIDELRRTVTATTAYATQGLLGATTPLNEHWQAGADLRLTRVGAIAPVPGILPLGLPSTGNLWSAGAQAIGTNLYSERDTHVFNVTLLRGPTYSGWLGSYNNLSVPFDRFQLEPSLRYYAQSGPSGLNTRRWTPGLRLNWRGGEKWVLESELSIESARTTGPAQNEHATRLYYTLGYRLEL